MTDKSQADQLAEPFPKEQLRTHQAKGLTYIPISEVIARLNRVLGIGGWNSRVLETKTFGTVGCETGEYPKWIVALVALEGVCDGNPFHYEGEGGQEVQFMRSQGNGPSKGPVDIGDNYKGAVSDAIKKAAQSLGVALDLAREDDAMHYEMATRQANEPKADPATLTAIEAFLKGLPANDAKRKSFTPFWNDLTGNGGPGKKFGSGQVTVREADQAIQYLGIEIKPKGKKDEAAEAEAPAENAELAEATTG